MKLIDSHCHLAMEEFKEDLDAVVRKAKEIGVSDMLTIGTSPEDWDATLEIARRYDLMSSLALSPHDALRWRGDTDKELERLLKDGAASAVGETGLDFHYFLSSEEEQKRSFEGHIKVAESLDLPLIIHSRDSFEETLSMLRRVKVPVILHCFTYGVKEAEAFLEEGFYISFSGIITFNRARELKEAAKIVPDDMILVETDSPYLAPVPHRGKRCEPAFIVDTAGCIARLKGMELEEFCSMTTANTEKAFRMK